MQIGTGCHTCDKYVEFMRKGARVIPKERVTRSGSDTGRLITWQEACQLVEESRRGVVWGDPRPVELTLKVIAWDFRSYRDVSEVFAPAKLDDALKHAEQLVAEDVVRSTCVIGCVSGEQVIVFGLWQAQSKQKEECNGYY